MSHDITPHMTQHDEVDLLSLSSFTLPLLCSLSHFLSSISTQQIKLNHTNGMNYSFAQLMPSIVQLHVLSYLSFLLSSILITIFCLLTWKCETASHRIASHHTTSHHSHPLIIDLPRLSRYLNQPCTRTGAEKKYLRTLPSPFIPPLHPSRPDFLPPSLSPSFSQQSINFTSLPSPTPHTVFFLLQPSRFYHSHPTATWISFHSIKTHSVPLHSTPFYSTSPPLTTAVRLPFHNYSAILQKCCPTRAFLSVAHAAPIYHRMHCWEPRNTRRW